MKHRLHEQNRRSWNAVTAAHNDHKIDQAAFLRDGGTTLFPDELALLGDVTDRRIAHLQCNCGQDTLSLARHAREVVGIDISDEAVAFARALSAESGIDANFVRSDLFDWFDAARAGGDLQPRFDVAFSSYGTIGWLSDVNRWARGVVDVLAPNGRLVLLEFHPLVWSLTGTGFGRDPYFASEPIPEPGGVDDYIGPTLAPSGFRPRDTAFTNPEPAHGFQWTVAQIVQAVIDAGLTIEVLREYPYANGAELFEGMRALPDNRFTMPDGSPLMPLMLGLVARAP